MPSMRRPSTLLLNFGREAALYLGKQIKGALVPDEHSVEGLLRRHRFVAVDDCELDHAFFEVDRADVGLGRNLQDARLLRSGEELKQVGERHLGDGARHGASRRWARARIGCIHLGLGVLDRGRPIGGHDLDDARADQDAVTLAELGPRDLLAVDEAPVRRTEVLQEDIAAFDGNLRVAPGHHVLDQDHVQLARAPDDDLAEIRKRKLPSLVLPRDETQRQRQRQTLDDQLPSLRPHCNETPPPYYG